MEIDFRKWLVALAVLIGLIIYVKEHYTFDDAMAYSNSHPDSPLAPRIDYYVGMVHFMRDEYPQSSAIFERVLTDYPTSQYAPKALIRLGTIYSEEMKWDRAREAYERYLKDYPDDPDADLVQKRYEFIKSR